MEEKIGLNEHNKQEYPPMHTVEHILNQTMVRMFGCGRSVSAHIERKKSKCDYLLTEAPSEARIREVEERVNRVIAENLPVWNERISREEATLRFDLERLPEVCADTLRIVHIGTYDACPCIGAHVDRTGEIGTFTIVSSDYTDGRLRLRFKLH